MPAAMERALKREATKKGLTGKHRDAYIYGTMRKTGWVPSTQKHNVSRQKSQEASASAAAYKDEGPKFKGSIS